MHKLIKVFPSFAAASAVTLLVGTYTVALSTVCAQDVMVGVLPTDIDLFIRFEPSGQGPESMDSEANPLTGDTEIFDVPAGVKRLEWDAR